jgi:ribosomal subunit interface protein
MNTRYLFTGLDIDERTREYIEKRLLRIEKLADWGDRFEIEVEREKRGHYRVEVMILGPHHQLRAEESTESVEASIDAVVDELQSQIIKRADKKETEELRGARSIKKKLVLDPNARF